MALKTFKYVGKLFKTRSRIEKNMSRRWKISERRHYSCDSRWLSFCAIINYDSIKVQMESSSSQRSGNRKWNSRRAPHTCVKWMENSDVTAEQCRWTKSRTQCLLVVLRNVLWDSNNNDVGWNEDKLHWQATTWYFSMTNYFQKEKTFRCSGPARIVYRRIVEWKEDIKMTACR